MATSIVDGLFGPTPDQLRQQQQEAINQQAMQYARMAPFERASMGMYQAGAGLAKPVAGMLGGVNPQEQQAQQQTDIQKQIDHSTADGLLKGAQLFQQAGNPRMASMYVQAAQAMKDKESQRALQAAQTQKALAYQPAGSREYEYQTMMDILNDPESSPAEKEMAQKRLDALNAKASGGGSRGTTAGRTMNTTIGILTFDPQAKKYTYADGSEVPADKLRTMMPIGNDPTNAAAVAQAKSGGKEVGTEAGKAQMTIPDLETAITQAEYLGKQLFAHPGFQSAVGVGIPAAGKLTGTNETGFMALHNQIVSGAFLQSAQQMRGLGQLTEVEGTKATEAANRMKVASNEKDYRAAYDDYIKFMNMGLEKLRKKASATYQAPTASVAAPVQPTAAPTGAPPQFSLADQVDSPFKVRAMVKAGKMSREAAKQILQDMQARGVTF